VADEDINQIIADALAEAEAKEKVTEARKKDTEATKEQKDALDALNQVSNVNRQQLEDINTALSAQLASFENTNEATDKYRAAVQASVRAQRDLVQAQAEGNKPLADSLKLIIENNNAQAKDLALKGDVTKAAVQVGDALLRNTEILSEHEQKLKDTEEMLRRFNDTSKFKSALALQTFSSALSTAGAGAMDFSAGGFAMVGTLTQMAFKLDSASNAMEINTGLGKESVNQMKTLVSENHELAIGTEEAQKAFSALNTSYSGFIGQNKAAQNELATTVVSMERLGVASQTSGKALDILDRSMGMTSDGARVALEDFDKLAQELSLPTGQVIEDFTKIGPKLARFGSDGKKQFEKLSKQARSLGIGVSEAFDLAEAFDTFEGAADLAGKLNAQLGLQLNSVDMMKAPHEERIKLLRQEFAASGKNFDQMSDRQRQAVAEMMGVDVSMAAKMFGDPIEYQQAAKDQEEARERAKRLTDVQAKLAKVGDRLMIAFGPVLKGFSALAEILTMKGVPETIGLITLLVGTFKSYLLVQKAIAAVTTASAGANKLLNASVFITNARTAIGNKLSAIKLALGKKGIVMTKAGIAVDKVKIGLERLKNFFTLAKIAKTPAVVAANAAEGAAELATVAPKTASATATTASGTASALAVGPTLAFGAAALMVGAAVYLAATGMADFISSFAGLNIEQLLAASFGFTALATGMGVLTFALPGLAASAAGSSPALYALAGAVIGIGAGMTLAGFGLSLAAGGMAEFVSSFANLEVGQILAAAVAFTAFATALYYLIPALQAFAASVVLGGTGVGIAALMGLGAAVMMIGQGIGMIADGASSAFGGISEVLSASSTVSPAQIASSMEVFDKIIQVSVESQVANVPALTAIAGAVGGQTGGADGGGGGGNKTVELKVNERILGDVVVDILKDRYGVNVFR